MPTTRANASDHTARHAFIAALLLVLLIAMLSACGDEDFTIGGPLPTRPPSTRSPAPTPTDDL